MNKPTEEQLDIALDAARRMQMFNVDPHHLASSLLYLSERQQELWDVVAQIDRHIRAGLPDAEMASLGTRIEQLRERTGEPELAPGLSASAAL